ncbi:MAG: radical SAM protein [Pseudomonadota bacterium]|uniref:B12-binding domain-containing radical SAM protein n=1 Tax=Candidatus Desulfatibia profunda TaxID=2841695 RepID=A0A8J6TI20_9BACT|nr:B12-binding domain-containing radical SAM protein [Candidatus Desulfatibia profunda]MBL7178657.1 B12-binding domain-containing radical SAM protein [Desulfobacterales bacterium]
MNIVLINVSGRQSSDGSRLISALLKRAGHRVKSVFLSRPEPLDYNADELEPLDEMLAESDLVMVAVYSSYAVRAVQVTQYIHKKFPGMKVIWGGPHCISVPELGLRYADGICFSEGDQAAVDFANRLEAGTDYLHTPNMAFNVNGTPLVNEVLAPFADLDGLPYYDYNLDEQFLLDQGLFQMTKTLLKERLAGYPYNVPVLYFITSRGCPHQCSYCNNSRYITLFGRNTMRFYSIDRVIEELEHTLEHLDFIEVVVFGDDDFFMRSKKQLAHFARKYKKSIGLPFGIAVSANTYHKEKMEVLLDSGLKVVQMGVQSGSQQTLDEVYHRRIRLSRTKAVVHQLASYHKTHGLDLLLDFIIDNPYETPDDIIQTYKYILDLPLHVRINIFFLAFFPGTPIYDRALKDRIIEPFNEKAFRFYTRSHVRYQKNYETFLILLARFIRRRRRLWPYCNNKLMLALGSRPVRKIASGLPGSCYALLSKSVQ